MIGDNVIKEDTVESFLRQIINKLILKGISSDDAVGSIYNMLELTERVGAPIQTVLQKAENSLREQQQIEANISKLKNQEEQTRRETNKALEERHIVKQNIDDYIAIKAKFQSFGLILADIKKRINIIDNIANLGYDLASIAEAFSSTENILKKRDAVEAETQKEEENLKKPKTQVQTTQTQLIEYSAMLAVMLELRTIVFAENALKMLTDILQQIAKKNKINTQLAAAQFLFKIKHNHDKVLGFKAALNNITAQVTEESKKLPDYP